jgi:hypothetical protein
MAVFPIRSDVMARFLWLRRSARVSSLLAATTIAVSSACSHSELDLPSYGNWTSTHFDYRTRQSDATTCPDVLETLENHFSELQNYLGFSWTAAARVSYYKFQDQADFRSHGTCPPDAGGCAVDTSVETPNALDEHELVHAYLYPTGFPPWVLVEGVAVALSCTSAGYTKPTLTWDQLATIPSGTVDPFTVYDAGAWLVGYLLNVFGGPQFLSLYASLPHAASASEMDAAFQSIYNQSLANIWATVLSDDQPRNNCVWECSRPPIALDGSTVDTLGPCGPDVKRPFTLSSEATISLSTTAADLLLGPCGQVVPPNTGVVGNEGAVAFYHLPAGSYFVDHNPVAGSLVGNADASATLNPVCSSATDSSSLSQPNVNVFVAVPSSTPTWFLALPPASSRRLLVLASYAPREAASLCTSCRAMSCVDATQTVDWNGSDVLMLQTDPSQAFSQFTPVLE